MRPQRIYLNSCIAGSSNGKEENNSISLTVPDQHMSVREILEKFASGTLSDVSREIEYSEDMPDLRGLDISQLQDMKVQAMMDIAQINEELELKQNENLENFKGSDPLPPNGVGSDREISNQERP